MKETFSTHDWSENFRMSRQTFMYICNELRVCIEKKDTTMRDSIRTEQRGNYIMVSIDWSRLPYHWALVWSS